MSAYLALGGVNGNGEGTRKGKLIDRYIDIVFERGG
jgi:hypothetical protein